MKNIKWGIPVSGVHTLSKRHHFIYSDGVRLHSTAVLLGGEYHIFESLKFFPWQKRWTLTNQSSSFSQLIYCVAVQFFFKKEAIFYWDLTASMIFFDLNWGKKNKNLNYMNETVIICIITAVIRETWHSKNPELKPRKSKANYFIRQAIKTRNVLKKRLFKWLTFRSIFLLAKYW